MGMGGQRHAPAALPRERPSTHYVGGWVGPTAGLDRCGKSRSQLVASHYTDWAIPAHASWSKCSLIVCY